jgi:hypothetical protein
MDMTKIPEIHCLICNKELRLFNHDANRPHRATIFYAPGNFGSEVHDLFAAAPELAIWICDGCLREKKDLVLERHTEPANPDRWELWNLDPEPL